MHYSKTTPWRTGFHRCAGYHWSSRGSNFKYNSWLRVALILSSKQERGGDYGGKCLAKWQIWLANCSAQVDGPMGLSKSMR